VREFDWVYWNASIQKHIRVWADLVCEFSGSILDEQRDTDAYSSWRAWDCWRASRMQWISLLRASLTILRCWFSWMISETTVARLAGKHVCTIEVSLSLLLLRRSVIEKHHHVNESLHESFSSTKLNSRAPVGRFVHCPVFLHSWGTRNEKSLVLIVNKCQSGRSTKIAPSACKLPTSKTLSFCLADLKSPC